MGYARRDTTATTIDVDMEIVSINRRLTRNLVRSTPRKLIFTNWVKCDALIGARPKEFPADLSGTSNPLNTYRRNRKATSASLEHRNVETPLRHARHPQAILPHVPVRHARESYGCPQCGTISRPIGRCPLPSVRPDSLPITHPEAR